MVDDQTDPITPTTKPDRINAKIYDSNQFTLPEPWVPEVGYQSDPHQTDNGAQVSWYHHKPQDKAVLANDNAKRSSLEFISAVSLGKISNDALETGDICGSPVTIPNEVINKLSEDLTQYDAVVLKPIYSHEQPKLDNTYISVYPAAKYFSGELTNVEQIIIPQQSDAESAPDYTGEAAEAGAKSDNISGNDDTSQSDELPQTTNVTNHINSI